MDSMRWLLPLCVGVAVLAACASTTKSEDASMNPGSSSSGLPLVTFRTASGAQAQLAVEVADESEEQSCGLMHRTQMADSQGMLFTFGEDVVGGFWNRNTLIALSVAYISATGEIIDIIPMAAIRPGEQPTIQQIRNPNRASIRYVIEANDGWFARQGISLGDTADVSAAVARATDAAPPPICREKGL